jgi:hypothetical protein
MVDVAEFEGGRVMAAVEVFAAQAENIGDSLLESAVAIVFEPTVANCDGLIATATGAITFARALRVELLKSQTAKVA